ITVSDNGVGMTPEVASRAFEPFFTTKRVGQGSGLGLSMVYGFVTQSGGHAALESVSGHGTRLRLLLPCSDTSAAAEPKAKAAGAGGSFLTSNGRGETILLVEDDPSVRHLATQLLRQLGYRYIE